MITVTELDERKDKVAQRVQQRFLENGMGMNMEEPEQDKYAMSGSVQIDCENCVYLCQAAAVVCGSRCHNKTSMKALFNGICSFPTLLPKITKVTAGIWNVPLAAAPSMLIVHCLVELSTVVRISASG